MKKIKILFFGSLIVTAFGLCSCSYFKKNTDDIVLARVHDATLTIADIKGIVPAHVKGKDSILLVKNYINNWAKQQVILNKAKQNLPEDKRTFQKQLEEYKNSLIIYTYEKEYVRQNLDTLVKEREIEDYYEKNKSNFELKENIIQVRYVKMPSNSAINSKVRQLYKSETETDKEALTEICEKYATNYFMDDELWLYFNDVLKEIPIKTYNHESFLRNNRFIEQQDSLYTYFINIKGFKIKDGESPLSFERENIRKIIINKRKLSLIEKLHQNLYDDAQNNNAIEIY